MKTKILMIIILLVSGCVTKEVWKTETYTEELTGFYFIPETERLIVSAKKYSYVLSSNDSIRDVLMLSRSVEFTPRYRRFYVDENNHVTGGVDLYISKNESSEHLLKDLYALGFVDAPLGKLIYRIDLEGKRYQLEGTLPEVELADKHEVVVESPRSMGGTIGKIVATPVAIIIDTVVVLPSTLLFVFVVVGSAVVN